MSVGEADDRGLEALLQFLKTKRGFDFTGYKRPSLERRFRRRMQAAGCDTFGDYLDFLEVHPAEFARLFDALLVNVTEFFRDPPVWERLREVAIPQLLHGKPAEDPIRVWSAGCATGQEACTIAMVLCEALGEDDYRDRVKIYGTDVDEQALAVARATTYAERDTESLPEGLRDRYFERSADGYTFRPDLRRTLIFGVSNLVSDAPISRLDLLVCRNTLMYLTAETQGRILRHFHFALRDHGVMLLGKSEMMLAQRDRFDPIDPRHRIFRRLDHRAGLQDQVAEVVRGGRIDWPAREGDAGESVGAALETAPPPHVVVSPGGRVIFANLAARALLGIAPDEVGRPFAELAVARTPANLLPALDRATAERRRVDVGRVGFRAPGGEERQLEITVIPLAGADDTRLGHSIVFEDVTRFAALQAQLESDRRGLGAAYEELQSTVDELETTNEELHTANEELQTTNEELHSTNEELETMNEELQSTNEELETTNDELRERTGELDSVNDFLESILTSLAVGVVVLDRAQKVQVWNRGAEDLWGVRPEEAVDRHFLGLDIGLQPERLAPSLRAVLAGVSAREVTRIETVDRRGKPIVCVTTVVPLVSRNGGPVPADGGGSAVRGAIVLMEDLPPDGTAAG